MLVVRSDEGSHGSRSSSSTLSSRGSRGSRVSKRKVKTKRRAKKKRGDEESERINMILASQPAPEQELNLSRSSNMEYVPVRDERGKVINLYDFLEEAKGKSYRAMCEAADEYGLEKAINARVEREMDDYIEQYSAA